MAGRLPCDLPAVLERRTKRLFDEQVEAGRKEITQYVNVGMVGRREEDRIEIGLREHRPVVGIDRAGRDSQVSRQTSLPLVGIGGGHHLDSIERLYVAQVLVAHHAEADETVTQRSHRRSPVVRGVAGTWSGKRP